MSNDHEQNERRDELENRLEHLKAFVIQAVDDVAEYWGDFSHDDNGGEIQVPEEFEALYAKHLTHEEEMESFSSKCEAIHDFKRRFVEIRKRIREDQQDIAAYNESYLPEGAEPIAFDCNFTE